jgi:hypothetical protein
LILLKYGDAYIELLEAYPCDNKMMLDKKEGGCIRAEPNCVNKVVAGRTQKEYREYIFLFMKYKILLFLDL